MADLTGFDANQHEPSVGFDAIPAGEYEAVIVASEMRDTTDKKGKYLWLELQILSGQYQNRKVWDRLNVLNFGTNKAKTEQIAKGTLSAICLRDQRADAERFERAAQQAAADQDHRRQGSPVRGQERGQSL